MDGLLVSSIHRTISPPRSSSPIDGWKTVKRREHVYHACAYNPLHVSHTTKSRAKFRRKVRSPKCTVEDDEHLGNIVRHIVPRRGAKPYESVKNVVPSKESVVGSYKWWGNRRDFVNKETLDKEYISLSTIVDNFNTNVAPQKYDRGSDVPQSVRYVNRGYISTASLLHILDCTEKDRYFRDRNMSTLPFDQRKSAGLSRYPRTPYIYGKRIKFSQIFRAGVIPVLRDGNGNFLYGFAVDSCKWNTTTEEHLLEISDFGGGLDIGESAAQGAIREWFEESEHLFNTYTIQPTDLVTYYAGFATYFVMIDIPFGTREYGETLEYGKQLEESYLQSVQDELPLKDVPEVRGLRWLSAKEIVQIIDHPPEIGGIYDQCLPFAVNIADIDMILHLSY